MKRLLLSLTACGFLFALGCGYGRGGDWILPSASQRAAWTAVATYRAYPI